MHAGARFVAVGLADDRVAVAGDDCIISVCDRESRTNVRRLGTVLEDINRLVASPDGRFLAAIFRGGVHIWDAVEERLVVEIDDLKVTATSLAFPYDGSTVATLSADDSVGLWDLRKGVPQFTLPACRSPYASIAFSSDRRLLLATTRDGNLHSWPAAGR